LKKDEGMIATETDWIDVPYDASNFGARAPLSWQVSADGVVTYAYRVQNKTMTLVFMIERSRVELTAEGSTNIPSNELYLRIPGSHLPARGAANPFWMGGVAGRECGYARVHPGHGQVILFRGTEERYPVDPGYFVVMGEITFEVQ
jgi:hypothetical protein